MSMGGQIGFYLNLQAYSFRFENSEALNIPWLLNDEHFII